MFMIMWSCIIILGLRFGRWYSYDFLAKVWDFKIWIWAEVWLFMVLRLMILDLLKQNDSMLKCRYVIETS